MPPLGRAPHPTARATTSTAVRRGWFLICTVTRPFTSAKRMMLVPVARAMDCSSSRTSMRCTSLSMRPPRRRNPGFTVRARAGSAVEWTGAGCRIVGRGTAEGGESDPIDDAGREMSDVGEEGRPSGCSACGRGADFGGVIREGAPRAVAGVDAGVEAGWGRSASQRQPLQTTAPRISQRHAGIRRAARRPGGGASRSGRGPRRRQGRVGSLRSDGF